MGTTRVRFFVSYARANQQRERFARELYGKIEDRLGDLYGP